jgi:hypothetical protein
MLAEAEQNGRGMVYFEAFAKRAAKIYQKIASKEVRTEITIR